MLGDKLTFGQVTPYIAGSLFATLALSLTIICYFRGLYRLSVGISGATLILLFLYKIAAMTTG